MVLSLSFILRICDSTLVSRPPILQSALPNCFLLNLRRRLWPKTLKHDTMQKTKPTHVGYYGWVVCWGRLGRWLLRVNRFSGIVAVVGRVDGVGAARRRRKVSRSSPRRGAADAECARPPGKVSVRYRYGTLYPGRCLRRGRAKRPLRLHSALSATYARREPSLEGIARKKTGLVSARRSKTELGAKHRKTLQRCPRGPKKKRWSASASARTRRTTTRRSCAKGASYPFPEKQTGESAHRKTAAACRLRQCALELQLLRDREAQKRSEKKLRRLEPASKPWRRQRLPSTRSCYEGALELADKAALEVKERQDADIKRDMERARREAPTRHAASKKRCEAIENERSRRKEAEAAAKRQDEARQVLASPEAWDDLDGLEALDGLRDEDLSTIKRAKACVAAILKHLSSARKATTEEAFTEARRGLTEQLALLKQRKCGC